MEFQYYLFLLTFLYEKALDRFFPSKSRIYKEFRPTYPEALYKYIICNLHSKVKHAGTVALVMVQVAAVLSDTFDQVFAHRT